MLMAAANSSGGVLGKMISPQNLAIGAAAVGMAGQEGDLFRMVVKWSLILLAAMVVIVYLQSTSVLSWMVVERADRGAAAHLRRRARRHRAPRAAHLRVRRAAAVRGRPAARPCCPAPARRWPPSCARATRRACRGWRAARAAACRAARCRSRTACSSSLSRLRRILEVDLDNQRVVCEPGVTNIAISAAVGPSHFYPPDPSSQIVCSIGGNVAENSGGAHCFKYGFTTNYVCGLEVVLPDGTVVRARRQGARPARLRPVRRLRRLGGHARRGDEDHRARRARRPSRCARSWPSSTSPGTPGTRVSDIVSAGVVPGAIEMMDNLTIGASEAMAHAGWPTRRRRGAARRARRPEAESRRRFDQVGELCEQARLQRGARRARRGRAPGSSGRCARPPSRPWAASRSHYYVQDSVIPRTRAAPRCSTASTSSPREYDLQVANVFHAGDGNLHPLVCYDGHAEGEAERAEELAGEIVVACVEAGGSITGEHGVGVDKKRYMPKMFSEADLDAFQKLRCAFDPDGLANPGKVMPTPRLCGEVPGPYREHPLEQAGLAERF